MTRVEAKKIVKDHTPSKYSNTAVLILLKMVDLTYRSSKPGAAPLPDNAELIVKTTISNLQRVGGVGTKQIGRVLTQLEDDGVLLNVERTARHFSGRVCFAELQKLDVYGDTQKADKKAADADRAKRARDAREIDRVEAAYRKANADMALNGQPQRNLLAKALANHRGPFTEEQQAAIDKMNAGEEIEKEMAEACEQQLRDMRARGTVNP